ncbi:nucleotidyltransferase domain-containing protein [Sphingomonas montana]|uniref:nucleotidyltransferase domain-containing protein n=1 Tax=Sphingomonas montana TaxID=1843236 RepID=UPI00096E1729|nr:nucleotidyltransferase domain-containing protein [Sphingomonas montana]
MRLKPHEVNAIKTAAVDAFGKDVVVRLFGSRVHDHLRGGDIDLLVEVDDDSTAARADGRFLAKLFEHIDEQRVDIVHAVRGCEPTPIVAIALRDGIVL